MDNTLEFRWIPGKDFDTAVFEYIAERLTALGFNDEYADSDWYDISDWVYSAVVDRYMDPKEFIIELDGMDAQCAILARHWYAYELSENEVLAIRKPSAPAKKPASRSVRLKAPAKKPAPKKPSQKKAPTKKTSAPRRR